MDYFSKYNLVKKNDGGETIIFNTLYKSIVYLEPKYSPFFDKETIDIESFPSKLYKFLKKNMMINSSNEENDLLDQFIQQTNFSDTYRFVFFSTLKCNLRCDYCYEDHINTVLNLSIYDQVYDYISTLDNPKIEVDWFGGEPLLTLPQMKKFTKRMFSLLSKENYSASITTNGTLLSPKVFKDCVDMNIYLYQITLDGLPETHDKHRPFANGSGSFYTIANNLSNIKSTDADVQIVIRVNMDKESDIDPLLTELEQFIGDDKRFFVYLYPIQKWCERTNNSLLLNNDSFEKVAGEAFRRHPKLQDYQLYSLMNSNLSCDYHKKNSFVINPNGLLTDCTIDYKKNAINDCTNMDFYNKNKPTAPLCTNFDCPLFPVCLGYLCKDADKKHCNDFVQTQREVLKRLFIKVKDIPDEE